jgi:high-affinity iron transporter
MGFREGLEVFLVIGIIIHYLRKLNRQDLIRFVAFGAVVGITLSISLGFGLNIIGQTQANTEFMAKVWESVASLLALLLVTTFIIFMLKHGQNISSQVHSQVDHNLSQTGVFLVSLMLVAREGVEIAIFTFAGKYSLLSVSGGMFAALMLCTLMSLALVKINLRTLFNVTLVYLVIQAGYLLGYGIHEGLSALKDGGYIAKNSILLVRAFDLSQTVLDHKEGLVGLPLNVLAGWYSRPEWLQFLAQYVYTITMFVLFFRSRQKQVCSLSNPQFQGA